MIGLFCFLIPILLFILTFPLKALVKAMELKLKIEERREKGSLLSRLDNWASDSNSQDDLKMVGKGVANTAKTSVKVAGKTLKVAGKTIHLSVKATKFTIKTTKRVAKMTVKTIRFMIKLIRLLITLIRALVVFLLSLGVIGIIILIIIVLVLVALCATVVIFSQSDSFNSSNGGTTGGFSGYNYMSIDWSQDFSAKLSEIESSYGVLNRNWTELVVINMRLDQQHNETALPINGFATGFKVIESGTTSVMSSNGSEQSGVYPSTSLSSLSAGGGGTSNDGPYQVEDSSLSMMIINSDYSSPTRSSQSTMRYFYPDSMLSVNTRLTNEGINVYKFGEHNHPEIEEAFSELGVTMSNDRYNILVNCLAVLIHSDGNMGDGYTNGVLSASANRERNKILSEFIIQFMQTYGWERNKIKVDLVRSMSSRNGWSTDNVYPYDDLQLPMIGKDGSGSVSSAINSSANLGVLDKDGVAINGTLLAYVMQSAPENIKSKAFSDSSGFATTFNTSWYKRCIYPLSVYLNSGFILDNAVDKLGLRDQVGVGTNETVSDGTIESIIDRESNAQKPNRIEYVLGGDAQYQADCSRYIASVLTEAGYDAFGITASNHKGYKTSDARYDLVSEAVSNGGGVDCNSETAWVRQNQPQAIIANSHSEFSISKLKVGDVCFVGGEHVVFYMGKNADGVDIINHASHTNGTGASTDKELKNKGYSVGYANFYNADNITFVFRPSLLK